MDFTNAQLKDLLVAAYSEITELRSSNKILTERNIAVEKEYDELRQDCWGPDESYISNQEWKSTYYQLHEEFDNLTDQHKEQSEYLEYIQKEYESMRADYSRVLEELEVLETRLNDEGYVDDIPLDPDYEDDFEDDGYDGYELAGPHLF